MNFLKLKQLTRDFTIQDLDQNPTRPFKLYAQSCTLNEWLKVYRQNKRCALWMYAYTPYCSPLENNHINLTSYTNDQNDHEYLIYFLKNHPLTKLTISGNTLEPEIVNAIEELKLLTHLSVKFEESSSFPFKSLPKIKTLKIQFFQESTLSHAYRINFTTLTHLTLTNCTITPPLAEALSKLKLEYIHIDQASDTPEDSRHINLFCNKKYVKLTGCDYLLVENLCRNCDNKQEHLTINCGSNPMYIAWSSLRDLIPYSSLQSIEIDVAITNRIEYHVFFFLLDIINKYPNLHWKITATIGFLNPYDYHFPTPTSLIRHIISEAEDITNKHKKVHFTILHTVRFSLKTYVTILGERSPNVASKIVPFAYDSLTY